MPPNNPRRRLHWNSQDHFKREKLAYQDILPSFANFERMVARSFFNLYPTIQVTSIVPEKEYIILNDLRIEGFEAIERPTPLSFKKCSLVLENLARFHAISFAFKNNDPVNFEKISNQLDEITFGPRPNASFPNIVNKTCQIFLPKLKEKYPEYVDQVEEFSKNYMENMKFCCNSSTEEDAVVLHGDCWISNLMFRKIVRNGFFVYIIFQYS